MSKLRLCFLVAADDPYWELFSRRLQKLLSGPLPREINDSIVIENHSPHETCAFSSEDTICILYHASSEASRAALAHQLPENVCLLCVSGGTLETETPFPPNAARHFYFTCTDADYACWLRWLEHWQDQSRYAPEGFVRSCTTLEISSECLAHVERWWEASKSTISKLQSLDPSADQDPVVISEISAKIGKIAEGFERVRGFCEQWAGSREHEFLRRDLWDISCVLGRMTRIVKETPRLNDVCRELEIKLTTIQHNYLMFRCLQEADGQYINILHSMGGSLSGLRSFVSVVGETEYFDRQEAEILEDLAFVTRRLQDLSENFMSLDDIAPLGHVRLHSWLAKQIRAGLNHLDLIGHAVDAAKNNLQLARCLSDEINSSLKALVHFRYGSEDEFRAVLFDHRFAYGTDEVM